MRWALVAAVSLLWAGWMPAQAPEKNPPAQNPPAQQNPTPPAGSNPFPEDTSDVPLMPNANTTPAPEAPVSTEMRAPALPGEDIDPVRSPDDPMPDMSSSSSESSSSSSTLDKLLQPPPDSEPTTRRKKSERTPAPEHQETAQDDENVGSYYLSEKNWKAALSRFESAVVLDPENPGVYWGLAEAQRHLGDLAEAKANYQKCWEYDPDGKHGKESKKILGSPEFANPPSAANKRTAAPQK